MKEPVFEGVCTALVTPFRNGTVDTQKLKQLLELQIRHGVSAVVLSGTTGESPTLTENEKETLLKTAVEYSAGRMKIIAGTGCNDTAGTVRSSRVAASMGADALLVVTPYYNRPSQSGLIDHFAAVADSVSRPVILYNVPSRTGTDLSVEACRILSEHPNINGIKEASGNLSKVQRMLECCGDSLPVWSGNDDQITAMMSIGGRGVISVLSNILPKETVRLVELCKLNDYQSAAKLQCEWMPLIDALFMEANPIPVKAAMNLLQYNVGLPRLPLTDLRASGKELLASLLDKYHVPLFSA